MKRGKMCYDELVKRLRDWPRVCVQYDGSVDQLHDEAADAIEELSKSKWIPVTERLPENGAEVLAWSSSGFAYVDWWIDGAWKVNGLVDGKYEFVTHWMPLPEPPKEE